MRYQTFEPETIEEFCELQKDLCESDDEFADVPQHDEEMEAERTPSSAELSNIRDLVRARFDGALPPGVHIIEAVDFEDFTQQFAALVKSEIQ